MGLGCRVNYSVGDLLVDAELVAVLVGTGLGLLVGAVGCAVRSKVDTADQEVEGYFEEEAYMEPIWTADEARKLMLEGRVLPGNLWKRIEETARVGRDTLLVDAREVTDGVIEELRRRGFTVDKDTLLGHSVVIGWPG